MGFPASSDCVLIRPVRLRVEEHPLPYAQRRTPARGVLIYRLIVKFGSSLVGRLRSVDARVFDATVAALMLSLILLDLAVPGRAQELYEFRDRDAFVVAAGVLAALSLVWRRRRPFLVHLTALACAIVPSLLDYNPGAIPLTVLVTTYTLAAYGQRRLAVVGLFVLLLALAAMVVLDVYGFEDVNAVFSFVLYTAAWVFGDSIRSRRVRLEAAEERAALLERQRAEDAQRAVTAERLHIAQELHDVVAHAMSVIAVQSGVAAHLIDRRPAQAKEALLAIQATSRSGLQELRRMLGVLRDEGDRRAALAPAPSLAALEALASRFRALGVDVTLEQEGGVADLPASLQLNAFRIVQEALTNVLRHAGPAAVRVRVVATADTLVVEVVDDGLGTGLPFVDGSEQGIVGMRERVSLFGGTLDAGPRADGTGFQVRACFAIDRRDAGEPPAPEPAVEAGSAS